MNVVSPQVGHQGFATDGAKGARALTGPLACQISRDPAHIAAAQHLRHRAFFGGPGRDQDGFDAECDHGLVTTGSGRPALAGFRLRTVTGPDDLAHCYTAQAYDLRGWREMPFPMVEVGRFCLDPDQDHPDTLRAAWAGIARYVDARGAGLLFGCASFAGCDPAAHKAALSLLARRHLGPAALQPGRRAAQTHSLTPSVPPGWEARQAMAQVPPLLRSYLRMGGWVSDHAVIDPRMQTLHVLTVVEVARIPAIRKSALLRLAQGLSTC